MTEAGKAYTAECEAAKLHLEELWNRCARVAAQGVSITAPGSSEGVTDTNGKHNTNSLGPIEANDAVSDLAADITIGKHIEEQSHITIRTDKHQDPSSPDCDMSIPPAT